MLVSAARNVSSAQVEAPGSGFQEMQGGGEATTDADLFALAHGATPASIAASQEPRQLDGRFHGALMTGGPGSGSDRPSYGGGGKRRLTQSDGLADCCEASEASEAQADSSLLTQPVLAAALNGVPESATWAMMILGFGLSGVMLRERRRSA